jgi:hypothetical protein
MNLKKYLNINLAFSFLIFTASWLLINDSYKVSRDEMWYADYSMKFDNSETNDIRHITEVDIHQVAFSHVFRYMERLVISLFGENLYGLRLLNLIFGMLMIYSVWISTKKIQPQARYFLFLYTVLISFTPILSLYSHHARPDWVMMSLITISILFSVIDFVKNDKRYLYGSVASAVLSGVIYWSGLAALAGILALYFTLFLINQRNIKYVYAFFATLLLVFLYYFLLFLFNGSELIALFSTEALQSGNLMSGKSLSMYWDNLILLLNYPTENGVTGYVLTALIFSPITFMLFYKDKMTAIDKKILLLFYVFFITYIVITLLRGQGIRYLYFIFPVLFFLNIYMCTVVRESSGKFFANIYITGLTCISVLSLVSTGLYAKNNSNQWESYKKYGADIENIVENVDGRLMTTYDFSWLWLDKSKFYLETFSFKEVESYEEFNNIMDKYNIGVILIGETTKKRIKKHNHKKTDLWYSYLNSFLDDKMIKADTIKNKFYRANKQNKPIDIDGYTTELWIRK